jgi:hypothetical protein
MDNINKDNLFKFISYFIIVFLLTTVLYLMYIDFITETFFNNYERFSDNNINYKLRKIHKIEELTNVQVDTFNPFDPLSIDPNKSYILKKDIVPTNNQPSITDSTCNVNDLTLNHNNKRICNINPINFYLNSSNSNKLLIKVLSDGLYSTPNSQNYSYYNYDAKITDITPPDYLSKIRKTNFYFPDNNTPTIYSKSRTFDYSNKYDKQIINYFNNYTKYNNYISYTNNPIINNLSSPSLTDTQLINTYFSYMQNILLLSNSNKDTPFEYKSGYTFDINDIKQHLIGLYNDLDKSLKINMIINDETTVSLYYDSVLNMNIYAFELNPSITITFTNLNLTFNSLPNNVTPNSVWSLYYVTKLTPVTSPDIVFSYNDNIKYPIVLPFAIPPVDNWQGNPSNGVLYYFDNLFKNNVFSNSTFMDVTNNNSIITNTNNNQIVINNLTNFIKLIGNTNLLSITDVFFMYDPSTHIAQSWIITNMLDQKTQNNIIAPIIYLSTSYIPKFCSAGLYYNGKCLPSCPKGFEYDLGLVCLNSNPQLYLPNTPTCSYINHLKLTPSTSIDPIMNGIMLGCDPKYFEKQKVISQSDITGQNF